MEQEGQNNPGPPGIRGLINFFVSWSGRPHKVGPAKFLGLTLWSLSFSARLSHRIQLVSLLSRFSEVSQQSCVAVLSKGLNFSPIPCDLGILECKDDIKSF